MPTLKNRPAPKRKASAKSGGNAQKLEGAKPSMAVGKARALDGNGGVTTARNLEERFDRGEAVLDYFDLSRIKATRPS